MLETGGMRAATIAAFAIVGWAVCAATIGIGFSLVTEREALVMHAIIAPITFRPHRGVRRPARLRGLLWLADARS